MDWRDRSQGRLSWPVRLCLGIVLVVSVGCAPLHTEQVKPNLRLTDYKRVSVLFQDRTAEPYAPGKITAGELQDFSQLTAQKLTALALFESVTPGPQESDLNIICEIDDLATSYRDFRFWTNLGPGQGAITYTTHFIDTQTGEEIARFRKKTQIPDLYRTVEGLVKMMMQAVSDDIITFVSLHL